MNDMVNASELLLNVVILGRRKMLKRLDQKVCDQEWVFVPHPSRMSCHRRKRQHLTHSMVFTRNVVSPTDARKGK